MPWCNNFVPRPSPKLGEVQESDIYDLNFAFPLHLETLENERVKLVPFIPSQLVALLYEQITTHPEIYRYIPFAIPKSVDELSLYFEVLFRSNPEHICFAIFDKTRPGPSVIEREESGSFAGTIGLVGTSQRKLSTEIGYIMVFSAFQRSHVASNAAGLMLHYCLNLPSDKESPGLGLRRVEWAAHPSNGRSIATAERLGFRHEGTLRWTWVLPESKEGNELKPRDGDPAGSGSVGRDSVLLSMCWDDWENGAKEALQRTMARVA